MRIIEDIAAIIFLVLLPDIVLELSGLYFWMERIVNRRASDAR